jgi:hypothetical protein
MDHLDDVQADIQAAASESDYTAVNTLWLALLKLANLEQGRTELVRMTTLVNRIPKDALCGILADEAVASLLNLHPPLETVLSYPREELRTKEVTEALAVIRSQRTSNLRAAMASLGSVLKSIRNKREHGFKTRMGPRDSVILSAARRLLELICSASLSSRSMA